MLTKDNYVLLLFTIIYCSVECHGPKSSLTFVIDDTSSMEDDINQVKRGTNDLFDAVLHSNSTRIDEFVLVTFNDPDTSLRTVTRDREEFKRALGEIEVANGEDCPEMAMSGLELALENSKPNSFFYVFTDASAKDYHKYENIKSIAQKKIIQITFLLTGECKNASRETYLVYDKLAVATSGQVFHIGRQDVYKVSLTLDTHINVNSISTAQF